MGMNSKITEAIEYLSKQDLAGMPAGKYPVNDDFYYMVQEYVSRPESDCHLESHQKYVDIQWVISGTEAIDCAAVDGLEVEKEYNPEKDITFWKEPAEMMRCVLSSGSYVVLLPENAHKPCIAVGEPMQMKKVVAKVKI